jgi:hypothetical protein
MENEITAAYTLCDELLKAMNIREDIQAKMNTAEVMTVALTAARFFGGHIRNASDFLKEHGYIPDMLSESRLNRRIHAADGSVWENLFCILSETFKKTNAGQEYIIDSFPVPVCDNIRISRAAIFKGKDFRGYLASKHRYFCGIRVHMIVTASGEPVEFVIAPGADADVRVFKQMNFDLPEKSICYGDKAYNGYSHEDMLRDASGIIFKPFRKKNSVRADDSYIERLASRNTRKRAETAFSQITNFFPKKIHAVTAKCFVLKVICFIVAMGIRCLTA